MIATTAMDHLGQAFTDIFRSSSNEEVDLCLLRNTLNPFAPEKGNAPGWISLLYEGELVLCSLCLLTLMEPIPVQK